MREIFWGDLSASTSLRSEFAQYDNRRLSSPVQLDGNCFPFQGRSPLNDIRVSPFADRGRAMLCVAM
jgi:hypothetical protein